MNRMVGQARVAFLAGKKEVPGFPFNAQYPRFPQRSSTEKKASFHPRADDRGRGTGYFLGHNKPGLLPQNPKGHTV
ncbi:MAG TPA: hypothetical protein PKA03_12970, partial [Tabrizicola sp.]|nr:hypothetical protein [Tabrizicola sp.]